MKCSQCKEKLTEYIEGNLSAQVDEEIKEHLLNCESCKKAYEEELLEYEAFKAAFSTEEINFESIAPKVMNSIDKNKYSKGIKIRKNRYMAPIAAALFICVAISPFALRYINGEMGANKEMADGRSIVQPSSEFSKEAKASDMQNYSSETPAEASQDNENNPLLKSNPNLEQSNYIDLYSMEAVTNPSIEDNTPYISTEDGVYEATIAGKGEFAQEEGLGTIYVKNNSNNVIQEIKQKNTDKQISPLSISWYDNNHLMIVQGFAYGTLANGVDIIVIDVTSGQQMLIATVEDSTLISYENVYRDGNDLVIETKRYTDEIMNEFVNEEIRVNDYKLGEVIK